MLSFDNLYSSSWRKQFLNNCLSRISKPADVICFFENYIRFNSIFAGCVSNLASRFHISQKLFCDRDKLPINIYSHSSQIASNIFAAAEDEFNAKKNKERITHREMACFFYDTLLEFYDSKHVVNRNQDNLSSLIEEAKVGYGFNQEITDLSIFKALGFHIASEELADQEFSVIDNYLENNFFDLLRFLNEKKHPSGLNAYYWIKSHCTVEKDHHENALMALEIALKYYSSAQSECQIKEQVLKGYEEFCTLQEKLFNAIVDFNSSDNRNAIIKYIETILEPKKETFAGFSACPYAFKEKSDNHIVFQSALLSFDNLDSNCKQIKSIFQKNIDKTLLTYDTNCLLTVSEFQELGRKTSELLRDVGIVIIGLHHNDDFNIKGYKTRTVPFPLFLIQSKNAISNGRQKLKQTDYYKNWTKEDLKNLDNLFGDYL